MVTLRPPFELQWLLGQTDPNSYDTVGLMGWQDPMIQVWYNRPILSNGTLGEVYTNEYISGSGGEHQMAYDQFGGKIKFVKKSDGSPVVLPGVVITTPLLLSCNGTFICEPGALGSRIFMAAKDMTGYSTGPHVSSKSMTYQVRLHSNVLQALQTVACAAALIAAARVRSAPPLPGGNLH